MVWRAPGGYVRIDNDLAGDERVLDLHPDLTLAAIGLHVLAFGLCDRRRTDGRITRASFRLLAQEVPPEVVAELERVGLWQADGDDCWVLADFLKWQRSAVEIAQLSDKRSRAAKTCARDSDTHPEQKADTDTDQTQRGSQDAEQGAEQSAGQVVRASGSHLTAVMALELIDRHGFDLALKSAQVARNAELAGTPIRAWMAYCDSVAERLRAQGWRPGDECREVTPCEVCGLSGHILADGASWPCPACNLDKLQGLEPDESKWPEAVRDGLTLEPPTCTEPPADTPLEVPDERTDAQ